MNDEDLILNPSPTSSDNGDTRVPPSSLSSQRQQQAIRTGQAGSRRGNMAADVFSFFEANGDKKQCKFCL
jgi:hypothetical protein